jgi:hypothetical protein
MAISVAKVCVINSGSVATCKVAHDMSTPSHPDPKDPAVERESARPWGHLIRKIEPHQIMEP